MRFCFWKLCIFAFCIVCVHGDGNPDHCDHYEVLDAGPRLHSLPNTDNVCDNILVTSWYRLEVGGVATVIPTTCLRNNVCGTQLPLRIDLGGQSLPTNGSIIQAHVCTSYNVLGQWDCCVLRQSVTIKDCGTFFIYHLPPSDRCPVAYCAEDPDQTDYQNISVKRGEFVQPTTSPSTDITTQADDTQSQTTSMASVSTTPLSPNTTDESSEQPVTNEAIPTSSLDMTTSSGVTNVTENLFSSSSPSNTTFDDVNEIPIDITSENVVSNETTATSVLETTTVAMTTNSMEEITDNITVTNVTDSSSSSTSQPIARRSDDVTDLSTTISDQASTYSDSGVTPSLLGNSTEQANMTATLPCLTWESSLCPDGHTICYKSPSLNTYFIPCNHGDVCGVVCDNIPDCSDEADETQDLCPSTVCGEGMQKCKNEDACYVRCNGHEECTNPVAFEDENDCNEPSVSNVTMTTELDSTNASTIVEATTSSTISNRTVEVSSSIAPNTSTAYPSDETATTDVSDTTTNTSDSSSTQPHIAVTTQQYDSDTTGTSDPLSANTTIGMDITSQFVDNATRASDWNTTSDQEEPIPLTTARPMPDSSTTGVNDSTTQTQSITNQTPLSGALTTHSVSSASHTTQSETTTGMDESTSEDSITDSVSTTLTQPDSTQAEYTHPSTSSYQTSEAPTTVSTSPDTFSTQMVDSSTSTTPQNHTDLSAITEGDTGAVVSTQSSDTLTFTSAVTSGSSNITTGSSSFSVTTSDTPAQSTAEVQTTSETTIPTTSLKGFSAYTSTDAALSLSSTSDISERDTSTPQTLGPTSSISVSTHAASSLSPTSDSSVAETTTTKSLGPLSSVPVSTDAAPSTSSTSDSSVPETTTSKSFGPMSSISVSTDAASLTSSTTGSSVAETTTTESGLAAEDGNTTTGVVLSTINVHPREEDKHGIIHDNFGLFVFIVVASTLLVAICVFGTVGYMYQQRRLRTWTPRMAYQDAYADLEKKNLSCPSYLAGIESPIPDIDIMHEEKVNMEETSLSQASTLALRPANGHENGFEHELRDSPSPKSLGNDSANSGADGEQTNNGFDGDNIDGIVPVEELDDEPPRALFPWIENAADTKL